jgi:hypothetical protein
MHKHGERLEQLPGGNKVCRGVNVVHFWIFFVQSNERLKDLASSYGFVKSRRRIWV